MIESDSNKELEKDNVKTEENTVGFNEKVQVLNVPLDCLHYFLLKNPGDFCLTKTEKCGLYLSILIPRDSFQSDEEHPIHLKIEQYDLEYGIRGMLFTRAPSLQQLIADLSNSPIHVLSGVLEKNVMMIRIINEAALLKANVFPKKEVLNKVVMSNDNMYNTFSAEVVLSKNTPEKVILLEPATPKFNEEFRRKLYEEMQMQAIANTRRLPIRVPLGAIIEPMALIYSNQKGYPLDYLLDTAQHCMDMCQRVKICASCVRIMSDFHTEGLFHGGVLASNFYAILTNETGSCRTFELLFNGADGIMMKGKKKTLECVDYDLYAPELAFTRSMTPESGVYSMGKLFEKILEPDISDSSDIMREMRYLIAVSTRNNPMQRPTMHGILLVIRQLLHKLPQKECSINFVHYDQFN
ncbi:unnamed protein product [Caenorhabditis bovis]|uniref:Protein kinase domain-containing protein n=1 Tax=Caenorhabditis bovis TaxID=2654633 RepID=A0A8S1E9V7_9PELO|nr:unnamed protein product [Caenorhabditis bovis]